MSSTTLDSTGHLKRLALSEKAMKLLRAAQHERVNRRGHVRTVLGDEPGWVVHERELMEGFVNQELQAAGKGPVDATEILSAEAKAASHGKDKFLRQFSLEVADLVLQRVL